METEKKFCILTYILVIIGALNWGLIGFFDIDFVAKIFGSSNHPIARAVYMTVGICGFYLILKSKFLSARVR